MNFQQSAAFAAGGIAVALLCLLDVTGCASAKRFPEPKLADAIRQGIYRRAGEEVKEVDLLKPQFADSGATALRLAPLILTQRRPATEPTEESRQVPTVWFYSIRQLIHGREHEQWTYFWRRPRAGKRAASFQGIRITLNSVGEPAIWEALNDSSGAELIWVAQSMEIAAAKEFGQALPGRICSIEPAISDAERVVVPEVVDDGPMPMGPIVYATAQGDIRGVACRCSATQAESLGAQGFYRLQEITSASARVKIGEGRVSANSIAEWFAPDRLESCLRLPKSF